MGPNVNLDKLPSADKLLQIAQGVDETVKTTSAAYHTFKGSYDYLKEAMGGAPNDTSSKRSRTDAELVTDAKTGKCRLRGTRKRMSRNVSSLIDGRSMFGAPLLPVLGEKELTPLRVNLGNKAYPDQLKSFLDMCLGVSAKTRTSFAGRCSAAPGIRTWHHELYRHNYSQNDSATAQAYPAFFESRVLTPQVVGNGFNPESPGVAGSLDTSFRDMSTLTRLGYVYYANYNRTDLEDLSWNQQRIRLAEDDSTQSSQPSWLVTNASVPQKQADQHRRWGAIATVNNGDGTVKPIRGLFKAVINYGRITYNFMNKGEGGAEVTVVVSKFKKGHLMSSTASDYHDVVDSFYPLNKSTDAIGEGWLQTMRANYSTQEFNGPTFAADDIVKNPCYPFMPQLAKTKQAEVDIKEVCRQSFAMPAGARRTLTIDLPGEVFNPLDFPVPTGTTTPSGRGILNDMTYCVTIAVNGTKATRFVTSLADTDVEKAEGGFAVGDMHGPANVQYYSTYEECVGPSIFTCPKKILLANNGGLMDPTQEFTVGYTQKTGVMLDQSAAVRVAPKVIKHYTGTGANASHTGTNVETGTSTIGNDGFARR